MIWKNLILAFAMGTLLLGMGPTAMAQDEAAGISEPFIQVNGAVVLITTLVAVFFWFRGAGRVGGMIGRFLHLLLIGLLILGINIAFGDFWSPVYLQNPYVVDLEDLIEIIGFVVIAISAWVLYRDIGPSLKKR